MVRHELPTDAGVRLEICLSGRHRHQCADRDRRDPVFQEEKDALNGTLFDIRGVE